MKRTRLLLLLALLMTAATGAWAQEPATTYSVKMKDGTKDAAKWSITSGQKSTTGDNADGLTGLNPKDAVTLNYSGRLRVKDVTATHDGWNGDLSSIPASAIQSDGRTVIVPDGITLKGTLNVMSTPYKIVIPAGATVTLAGATINGKNNFSYQWAGITCEGNATIILKDDTENKVTGFEQNYPGIYVPAGSTLIILGGSDGNGKLTASSNNYAAGIGAGYYPASCGNIEIQGGDIKAFGGRSSAGIGGGPSARCGNITISGGTVTASGEGAGIGSGCDSGATCGDITISGGTVKATSNVFGAGIGSGDGVSCGNITISGGTVEAKATYYAAGIGSGLNATSGNITITDGVTKVTATRGEYATHSIGEGGYSEGRQSTCGTVTIGDKVYWENNYAVDDAAATYLAQAKIVYPKWDGDLSKLTAESTAEFATATDGMTITGTLAANVKVSIAAGATVTLDGVIIVGVDDVNYKWAGLNCLGDATIILKDGTENEVSGFYQFYPGIHVPEGSRLTITGGTEGNLLAISYGYGAGIGGGNNIPCGNIDIQGGNIMARGGLYSAGIGGGSDGSCGNITISGGTVTAMGGSEAAGIGSGHDGSCGNIMITNGVTMVSATKGGEEAPYSIGAGNRGSCVTVAIGGTLDTYGNPVGGTKYWENDAAVDTDAEDYLRQATIIYPEP